MKKFAKVPSLMLAATIGFSLLFSGCGSEASVGSEKGTTAPQTSQTSSQEKDTKLEPATLTWYYPGPYPQNDQDTVFKKLNEMSKAKINTEVNYMPLAWGDYESKMKVIDAGGEAYDLCFTSNWTNNYIQNVSKGAYLPLDDLLKKYAPKTFSSIPEKFWKAAKVQGKIYGIINYQIAARTTAFAVNKEVADKYGFNPDSLANNMDNLEPFFSTLAKNEPKLVPISYGWAGNSFYFNQENIGGDAIPGAIYLNDASAKVINQFESKEFKDYVEHQIKWEKAGYLHGSEMIASKDGQALISQGKIISWVSGTYKPGVEAETSATYGVPVYVRAVSDAYVTVGGVTSTMHAISRNSQNPERAMMFMELMNTDKEIYNTLAFGIEGKHYKKLDGEYIEQIKDSGYAPSTLWLHASTFNAYLLKGQDADVWEQTKKMNESAKESPLLGFNFTPDTVKTEIAQCSNVVGAYVGILSSGLGTMEKEYPEFINKLNKAGAQKIIGEMQKQIDAWKAGN